MAFRCAIFRASFSMTRFTTDFTREAPTPHRYCKAMPLQVGMEEGQRLSVLAGCGIANTAKRTLISVLFCQTS
jgi:hypothetical protein